MSVYTELANLSAAMGAVASAFGGDDLPSQLVAVQARVIDALDERARTLDRLSRNRVEPLNQRLNEFVGRTGSGARLARGADAGRRVGDQRSKETGGLRPRRSTPSPRPSPRAARSFSPPLRVPPKRPRPSGTRWSTRRSRAFPG